MKYPLDKMLIGDSFFVPEPLTRSRQNSLYALAKKRGCKVSIRKWVEDETSGFRVWYLGPISGNLNTREARAEVNRLADLHTT